MITLEWSNSLNKYMKILKQLFNYIFWAIISMFFSLGYVRIILGSKVEETTKLNEFYNWIYDLVIVYVVPIIGGIITVSFILTDMLYLRKKLQNKSKTEKFLTRLTAMLILTIVIGALHYFLEKVIDVI